MPENSAAWLTAPKASPLEVKEAPYPSPGPNEVVIKNSAVAINPIDWMFQSTDFAGMIGTYPAIIGEDIAGVVESVGSSVTRFKLGDRVHGGADSVGSNNAAQGAFQLFTVLNEGRLAHIPESMAFEKACVLPGAVHTATLLLFEPSLLGLKKPALNTAQGAAGEAVVIWGGSSSVGSCCLQFARAAGYEVITTASKRNHEYCKELGATEVFDYRNADTVVDEILGALRGKKLAGAIDTVAQESSVSALGQVLQKTEGRKKLCTTLPAKEQEGIEIVMVNSLFSPYIDEIWTDYLPKAMETGEILPKPDPIVVGSGLETIQTAMDKSKAGVSAGKLVVKL